MSTALKCYNAGGEITIPFPTKNVWEYLEDANHIEDYNPQKEPNHTVNRLQKGSVFTICSSKTLYSKWRVSTCIARHLLTFQLLSYSRPSLDIAMTQTYTLQRLDDQTSILSLNYDYRPTTSEGCESVSQQLSKIQHSVHKRLELIGEQIEKRFSLKRAPSPLPQEEQPPVKKHKPD